MDAKILDKKTLTELQYLKQLVEEAINRKIPSDACTCKGFYIPIDCPPKNTEGIKDE